MPADAAFTRSDSVREAMLSSSRRGTFKAPKVLTAVGVKAEKAKDKVKDVRRGSVLGLSPRDSPISPNEAEEAALAFPQVKTPASPSAASATSGTSAATFQTAASDPDTKRTNI